MTTKEYQDTGATEYDIGGQITLVMVKGRNGFQGHYFKNNKPGAVITFEAPGMTKKQILRKFWDIVN